MFTKPLHGGPTAADLSRTSCGNTHLRVMSPTSYWHWWCGYFYSSNCLFISWWL